MNRGSIREGVVTGAYACDVEEGTPVEVLQLTDVNSNMTETQSASR